MKKEAKELYSIADASAYLGISDTCLRDSCRRYGIELVKDGRRIYVRRADLKKINELRQAENACGAGLSTANGKGRVKTLHYRVSYSYEHENQRTGLMKTSTGFFNMLAHHRDTTDEIIDKAFRMMRDSIEIRQYKNNRPVPVITSIVRTDSRWENALEDPIYTA